MDTYAAERIAARKFIEHKGQNFLRQNTQKLIKTKETRGDTFRMIWTLEDHVLPEDRLITGEEPQKQIIIAVNLDTGVVTVEKDTIETLEEEQYKDIIDKSWIAKEE